jgi:hypothetical protein
MVRAPPPYHLYDLQISDSISGRQPWTCRRIYFAWCITRRFHLQPHRGHERQSAYIYFNAVSIPKYFIACCRLRSSAQRQPRLFSFFTAPITPYLMHYADGFKSLKSREKPPLKAPVSKRSHARLELGGPAAYSPKTSRTFDSIVIPRYGHAPRAWTAAKHQVRC